MQTEKIFRTEVLRTLGDAIARLRELKVQREEAGSKNVKEDRRIEALTVGYLFLVNHMPLGPV